MSRAQTFLDSVGAVPSPCLFRRKYSEIKSLYVHTKLIHCAPQTLRGFVVVEDVQFSQVMRPSTHSMTRRNRQITNGEARPIPLGGNVSRSMMNSSLPAPALSLVPSDQFYDTMEITIPMQVELASRREPVADALYGLGGYENMILGMESQELSIRSRISEEMARSELEAMERDARCAFFYRDQQFEIAVRGYQRQARDAVCQATTESSDNYEIMMMQEFSRCSESIWRILWKKMKEEWRTCSASKHEKLHLVEEAMCSMNIKEKGRRVREKPDAQGATVTHCKLSKILTWSRSSTRANHTQLGIPGGATKSQVQTEELMMTSPKESCQETSERERQAVISAQQLATSLQNDMSQATAAVLLGKQRT